MINIKLLKRIKILLLLLSLVLLSACKTEKKEVDYKTLEGTPFHFENYKPTRQLHGQDFIKVLDNHNFILGGRDEVETTPFILFSHANILRLRFNGEFFTGFPKVIENGNAVYAQMNNPYENYSINLKLKPSLIDGEHFAFAIDVEERGNESRIHLKGRCKNNCRLGCSNTYD